MNKTNMNIMNMNIGHIHIRNIHEYSHYSYFISIAISAMLSKDEPSSLKPNLLAENRYASRYYQKLIKYISLNIS